MILAIGIFVVVGIIAVFFAYICSMQKIDDPEEKDLESLKKFFN